MEQQTEFDILKSSHRFLRTEDEEDQHLTWDDKLAKKYYDNLYREFAVCNLKHYKTGNFALRWRTEGEVLSGMGESTCGNTRCRRHSPESGDKRPRLNTVELPFAYQEHGELRSALVKVVLCDRCLTKLMYKRTKEKEAGIQVKEEQDIDEFPPLSKQIPGSSHSREERVNSRSNDSGRLQRRDSERIDQRRRNSRSRSPRPWAKPYRRRSFSP